MLQTTNDLILRKVPLVIATRHIIVQVDKTHTLKDKHLNEET